MLRELRVSEMRYRVVLEVLDGAVISTVALRYGMSRQTVHEWLRRYARDGAVLNLEDRSSRPYWCPHQMAAELEARVLVFPSGAEGVCVVRKEPFVLAGNHERVRPMKMSDQVAAQIRRMIARGEPVDGDWLRTEAELIERFGVSRLTLREAFRRLEGDSLVTIRRGPPGGARVTVRGPDAVADLFGMILMLSGTTIGDVWDARLTIEPPAVRRLAESATKEALKELDAELDRVRAAIDDPREFSKAGVQCHVKLVQLSGKHCQALATTACSLIFDLRNAIPSKLSKTTYAKAA